MQKPDFMTTQWAHLPHSLPGKVSNRIINEGRGTNDVVYDVSGKSPATIEWESSPSHRAVGIRIAPAARVLGKSEAGQGLGRGGDRTIPAAYHLLLAIIFRQELQTIPWEAVKHRILRRIGKQCRVGIGLTRSSIGLHVLRA